MYNFRVFLQDLNRSTGIKFNLEGEDKNLIFNGEMNLNDRKVINFPVYLGENKATVCIENTYEVCISLLKYTIESKYRELFSMREQFLVDILEGKEVALDKIEKSIPFLSKGSVVFVISVDSSRYEALSIIRQLYKEQDLITTIYGDDVIVIGTFEDIWDEARGIYDSIVSELYCKCSIGYGDIAYRVESIKKSYEEAKECIRLGKIFGIKEEVFNYNKLLFEKIVYNVNDKVKNELMDKFKEKFSIFDIEMINTIEEFVNCDLNISDAAKKLYIHRNTLIYRLDKIAKETDFDIRNFKEAAVFIIAFLVWKGSKYK